MQNPNRNNFRVVARMDKDTFNKLLDLLVDDGGLEPSPSICEGQKLMIFIEAEAAIILVLCKDLEFLFQGINLALQL